MAENNEKTTNAVDIETKPRSAYLLLREAIIDHSPASESLKDAINVLDLQFLGGNEQTGTPGLVQQVKGSIGSGMSWNGILQREFFKENLTELAKYLPEIQVLRNRGVGIIKEGSRNPLSMLVRTWRAGLAISKRYDQCEKSFSDSLSEGERRDYDEYVTISFCILLGIMVAILVVVVIFLSYMKI